MLDQWKHHAKADSREFRDIGFKKFFLCFLLSIEKLILEFIYQKKILFWVIEQMIHLLAECTKNLEII